MLKRLAPTTVLVVMVISSLTIIGCSVQKKLNEMHDSTAHMDKTTSHMDGVMTDFKGSVDATNVNLEGMKKTENYLANSTDTLKSAMAEVLDQGRQGQSMDDRRKLLLTTMRSEEALGAKIGTAVQYFMSFEYQLWTNGAVPGDTLERRQALINDAVNEFFTMIGEYWAETPTVYPFGRSGLLLQDTVKNADNFNALAAGLEYMNRVQVEIVEQHPEIQKVNMLKLIEDALADQPNVDYGKKSWKTVSLAELKIQANRQVAIKLLQARQSVLPLLALAKTSPLGLDGSGGAKILNPLTGWAMNINNLGAATVAESMYFLSEAQKARAFMRSLKDPRAVPQNDGHMKMAWGNGQVVFDIKAANQSNGSDLATDKQQLAALVGAEKQFHESN